MNPGGDYGKRELSPALRNRFTEIWVPNTQCIEDIRMIIKDRMEMKGIQQSAVETLLPFIDTLIEFMDFWILLSASIDVAEPTLCLIIQARTS